MKNSIQKVKKISGYLLLFEQKKRKKEKLLL